MAIDFELLNCSFVKQGQLLVQHESGAPNDKHMFITVISHHITALFKPGKWFNKELSFSTCLCFQILSITLFAHHWMMLHP